MIKTIRDFATWPKTGSENPIFTCSEDAIFYAHLITDKVQERAKIAKLREKVVFGLKGMRASGNTSPSRMIDLAVKGKFYRECLEEIERIEKEV